MPTTQEWNFCSVGGTGAHRVDRAAQIGPGRAISLEFTQLCHTKSRAKPTTDKLADKHPGPWQKMSHIFCLAIIHLPTYPSIHLPAHPPFHPPPPPTIIHSLIHPPIRPHCEVRLAFQPKTCCLRARKEHTIRSRTRHLVLRHLAPLGFLVVPTLFLRDASLAHIPCPHSSCPTGSVPALSSLPGHRSGSTGTGRGDEEPRGALWLHPPAPQWGGSKQMHEALHRTLLSHLTLFHFFFYKTPP